ncbi:MAG: hypothetical protein ACREXR_01410, partial [Gammaproteobacteria bacterium]
MKAGEAVGRVPLVGRAVEEEAGRPTAIDYGVRSGIAHYRGIFDGVMSGEPTFSDEERSELRNKLLISSPLFPAFYAGASVEIASDTWNTISALVESIFALDEVINNVTELLEILTSPEGQEVAYALGVEIGRTFRQEIKALVNDNQLKFTYKLGTIVGPPILLAVLSIVTGGIVGAGVLAKRLAEILRKLPGANRILSRMERKWKKSKPSELESTSGVKESPLEPVPQREGPEVGGIAKPAATSGQAQGEVFDFPRPPGRVRGPQQFLERHRGRLESKDGAIEDIFRRTSHPNNPIARRSAAGELAVLERTLQRGDVQKITIVPAKKGTKTRSGESPDFIVEFVDGTKRPLEVTTVTSAPRGRVTQKAREFETVSEKKGSRQVKKTSSTGGLREKTIERRPEQKDYERAVFEKAVPKHPARRKPLQVERDIEGVVPEGVVAIHAPFGETTDLSKIQGAMKKFSSKIHPRIHRIEFSFGTNPQ